MYLINYDISSDISQFNTFLYALVFPQAYNYYAN